MDELSKQFERGDIPNVLELMSAISELSNFWPGDDCIDCRGNSCEKTDLVHRHQQYSQPPLKT